MEARRAKLFQLTEELLDPLCRWNENLQAVDWMIMLKYVGACVGVRFDLSLLILMETHTIPTENPWSGRQLPGNWPQQTIHLDTGASDIRDGKLWLIQETSPHET